MQDTYYFHRIKFRGILSKKYFFSTIADNDYNEIKKDLKYSVQTLKYSKME